MRYWSLNVVLPSRFRIRRLQKTLPLVVVYLVFYIVSGFHPYLYSTESPPDEPAHIQRDLKTPCKFDLVQLGMDWDPQVMRRPELVEYVKQNVLKSTAVNIPENQELMKKMVLVDEEVGGVLPQFQPGDDFYDPSVEQTMKLRVIPRFFANYTAPGIFFEGGTSDTEYHSMTYYLEKRLGWRGILVEPNPDRNPLHNALKRRRHNVFVAPACISPGGRPCLGKLVFSDDPYTNRTRALEVHPQNSDGVNVVETFPNWHTSTNMSTILKAFVICYPVYTFIKAANLNRIDFMSIDIGKIDLSSLQYFPWKEIPVKVVRLRTAEDIPDTEIAKRIAWMTYIGFVYHEDLTVQRKRGNDYFFQKSKSEVRSH